MTGDPGSREIPGGDRNLTGFDIRGSHVRGGKKTGIWAKKGWTKNLPIATNKRGGKNGGGG